ncbi:MAG: TatD family hydrolase [Bacteroides sp.]|nr:TatD family hydrolase [Bacteroides sp.]
MVDTHSHIYMEEFSDGGGDALARALAAGVTHIVLPNVDASTIAPMCSLHDRFPQHTSVALGLHPTEVGDDWREVVAQMEHSLEKGGFAAVGEVGLDLYWDTSRREQQLEAFREQLRIADRFNLPVIIHCREALEDTLAVIHEVAPRVRLIFHSFTGSPDDVKRIREVCDPMFGINGVVTFKNAQQLREALSEITLDRMLLETDSPYLAPVPYRGKRNESSYLPSICAKIAETLEVTTEEVEIKTTENAVTVFGL